MSIQKKIKNHIDYCPQPPMPLVRSLKRHSLPIAVAVTAILVLSIAFSIFVSMPKTIPIPITPPPITPPEKTTYEIQTIANTYGNVSNPNGIISDLSGDDAVTRICGTGSYIIGDLGCVVHPLAFIKVNADIAEDANKAEGNPSTIRIFISDSVNGPWTEMGSGIDVRGPTSWSFGYSLNVRFSYIKISCDSDVDLCINSIKIISAL